MSVREREPRQERVFISYLNREPSREKATLLAETLEQRLGFNVFFDANKLRPAAGVKWADTLFQEARNADVLIVLVQPDTSKSDWVKHEVSTARGANVSILPIMVGIEDISQSLKKLALDNLQYRKFEDLQHNWESLSGNIESLARETRIKQGDWFKELEDLRRIDRPVDNEPKRATFMLNDVRNVRVHVALGDMTSREMGPIDVLVNSENDHMQMARVFERHTLSSRLRYKGSRVVDNAYLMEDTVQQELDLMLQSSGQRGRPVATTTVVVTHAGHPDSKLSRRFVNGEKVGSRYIFHVASVSVSHNRDNQVVPVKTPDEISACAYNALEKVMIVNENQGVISPEGCGACQKEKEAVGAYELIESIILPLFGAGRGGNHASFVIPHMVSGIQRFLLEHGYSRDLSLKDIYLCIYSESDVKAAQEAFIDAGFREV